MPTEINPNVARGRRLAEELDERVEDLLHDIGTLMLEETPLVKALVITRVLSSIDLRQGIELLPLRQQAIRVMRFPDGDYTATPAMGWREIGTLVGLTPTRAQQIADLPGDRGGLRPRRS